MEPHTWVHQFTDGNAVAIRGEWPDHSDSPIFTAKWSKEPDWKKNKAEYKAFRNSCAEAFLNIAPPERVMKFAMIKMIEKHLR